MFEMCEVVCVEDYVGGVCLVEEVYVFVILLCS